MPAKTAHGEAEDPRILASLIDNARARDSASRAAGHTYLANTNDAYNFPADITARCHIDKDFEPLPVLRDNWQLEVAPASGNDMAESERAKAIRQVLR